MQLSGLLLLLQKGAKSGSRHKDVEASQTCFSHPEVEERWVHLWCTFRAFFGADNA